MAESGRHRRPSRAGQAASGPPEPASGDGGPAPLPAPYESPERRLATDLRDLLASWRLRARELWRRNGEGDLPRPGFWPQALAAWFWPLLAGLALALVTALVLQLKPASLPAGPPAGGGSSGETGAQAGTVDLSSVSGGDPAGASPGERGAAPGAGSRGARSPEAASAEASGPQGARPDGDPADQRTEAGKAAGSEAADAGMAASGSVGSGSTGSGPAGTGDGGTEPKPGGDPRQALLAALLAALQGAEQEAWIVALEPLAPEGLLRLRLSAGYGALAEERRRSLAESWLEHARAEGYERLELRDPSGRLIGRTARVGSGMILLEPGLSSPP